MQARSLGRPTLFPDGRQVSVLISADDYRAINELVARTRASRPGYNCGDLLRRYIRRGLDGDLARRPLDAPADPKQTPIRQLFALSRRARRIALELEGRGK